MYIYMYFGELYIKKALICSSCFWVEMSCFGI